MEEGTLNEIRSKLKPLPKARLIYTIAFDPKDSVSSRQMAKFLAAGSSRIYFSGLTLFIRNTDQPIFLLRA